MKQQKSYVRKDGTMVLKCPYCSHSRVVSVSRFKEKKKNIKIKCSCSMTFIVILELRRMFRKNTYLKGSFINYSRTEYKGAYVRGKIIVKNLSMGGIGFETAEKCNIEKDDELEVTFTLDDIHSSEINKRVLVKTITGNFVGCEFKTTSLQYDKALGFYLMP